jgi:hypothetical protein
MATLFIHAPYKKAPPCGRYSFEYIYKTGIGEGYAIERKWEGIIKPGWSVVLLRCDKDKKRAEGILRELEQTGIYVTGRQRYNVHIAGLKKVPFKKEVKFNHYGVALIDC